MTTSVKIFKLNKTYLNVLTSDEKKVLPLLIEAAKKINKVYLLQENSQFEEANFYPHDTTREEIEEVAKKNPKIFSPFTVVQRSQSGKLIAIDYHRKYQELLAPIVRLLEQASKISRNKSFKEYLISQAKALVDGSYQTADAAWLAVKDSNICMTIGPHERYLDKLFFVKRAYQASVGIVDATLTEKTKIVRDTLYSTTGQHPGRIIPPSIVETQVQYSLIISGFLSRALFSRQHLPSDSETTARYGSKILGYLSVIDYKFEKLIYPIFNAVFEKNFKLSYSRALLERGNYYYVLLVAIAQQLHRYQNSRLRLKELFPIIDQANSVASGIAHAKHLVLKGLLDQKELEATLIAQICWAFSEWVLSKNTKIRDDYLKGDALVFNFLSSVGALQEKEGISWPNFAKIFFEMENLALIFTRFLEEGTHLQVQEFLSKYLTTEPFRAFDRHLAHIKPL